MRIDPLDMTYPPLGRLKSIAEEVWIVDGPIIQFGIPWPKFPFSTRTTIVRLSGGLFIHSPTPLTSILKSELDELGPTKWIVSPNRMHDSWISEWHAMYPDATLYLAPKTAEQLRGRTLRHAETLEGTSGYPWDVELATLPIVSRFMTEVEFFHRPSRTLILTDLIENLEADKLRFWMRLIARMGGVLAPHGSTPRDFRVTFHGRRAELRAAAETMISWRPERIILAHGLCYEENGEVELRRALRWALA